MNSARLGIFYKNFALWKGISHIGLGVAALANSEQLNSHGENATVFPVRHNIDIMQSILNYQTEQKQPLTHVIISAPWISTRDIAALVGHFNTIQWLVVSHSNVGFLQADPSGIRLLRDYIELAAKFDNFSVGGNSPRFVNWLSEAYNTHAVLLPNMYPTSMFNSRIIHNIKQWLSGTIKIGSFGAIRPLKNQLTAAAAAIIISERLKAPVEFHVSAGREEGGGNVVLSAIEQMLSDMPNITLVKDGWRGWHEFRELTSEMDLLIHPSYTESFNIVTADGIAHGVPAVVSPAIYWLPDNWKADNDDAIEIAEVGINLLKKGADEGIQALNNHNTQSLELWKKFLRT